MKRIVIASSQDLDEAMYVDGALVTCEQTIYASEIADAAGGQPILLLARQVELGDDDSFPKNESELVDAE